MPKFLCKNLGSNQGPITLPWLPMDPQLAQLAEENTRLVSIRSSPPGATVEIQDYVSPGNSWYHLGATPLTSIQIPNGYFRWKVSKAGIGEYIASASNHQGHKPPP